MLLVTLSPVHAQSCDAPIPEGTTDRTRVAVDSLNKCAIEKNVFDDKIFNTNQMVGTVDSLNTLLFGTSQLHPETNAITRSSALAATTNMITALYSSPPASGVQYIANQIHKFNPVQPAYAAEGIGFNTLQPVQRVWTVFRNISYVGFVIVFVIVGFMIMFRAHISPQAVATIQDSIPRIVIALILVTFSYAIAGLMIDLMFVFLNIIISALTQFGLIAHGKENVVFEHTIFGIIGGSWIDLFKETAGSISTIIKDVIDIGLPGWAESLIGGFGGGLAALVVGIAVLFVMFRIFFMLLVAYAMIIILTMVAPFFFLFQALPGRNGAGEWFKQMTSQIAVFPTAALMVIFAGILANLDSIAGSSAETVITNQNTGQFPLLSGGLHPEAIGGLIGIGILMLTPQATEIVRNALGVKGGAANLAGGVGAGLAAGAGVVGAGAKWGTSGGGPIADWRKSREAGKETYRGLLGREYANRKWENKAKGDLPKF